MTPFGLEQYLKQWRADLDARLMRIEASLTKLCNAKPPKAFYTVGEFAELVNRAEYTVREWARLGRLNAEKALGGRGDRPEWRIAHKELLRFEAEGLLPEREAQHAQKRTLWDHEEGSSERPISDLPPKG